MSPFVRLSFAFRNKMPPGEPQQPKRKKDKTLRGAILYGPRDVRFDERATPSIIESTDAIISLSMSWNCGSDMWAGAVGYRFILRFGQRWLSNFVRAHAAGDWSAVTHLARPARRRHVGGKRIRELPITPDKLL